jgi:hypothetical protein
LLNGSAVGNVYLLGNKYIFRKLGSESFFSPLQAFGIVVVDNDTGAFGGKFPGNGFADTAGASRYQCNAARQRFWFWHPLQLGFFQQPVFNIERFLPRQGRVFRNRFRPFHYIDGIEVKLGRHPCRLLVFCKGEHAHARINDHNRIGIAHGRAVGMFAGIVIVRIHGAVLLKLRREGFF